MSHTELPAARHRGLRWLPHWLGVERDPGGAPELALSSLGGAVVVMRLLKALHPPGADLRQPSEAMAAS